MKKTKDESWIGAFPLPHETARALRMQCLREDIEIRHCMRALVLDFLRDPPKRVIEAARKMK